jgi:hypothetical protein
MQFSVVVVVVVMITSGKNLTEHVARITDEKLFHNFGWKTLREGTTWKT